MAAVLTELSDELAKSVEAAAPSVVRIEGRRRLAGSGFIWSADGLIVTANHVVRKDSAIRVGLHDGQTLEADVAGRDPSTDLAVLKLEADGLTTITPAAKDYQVGHLVLALGRPGRSVQATMGILSALGDSWRTSMGGQIDRYVQTDVVMYPGFSGGPLVGAGGLVLGMNSSALMRGVSMTVPTTTLEQVVEALATHGRLKRGYLGVSTQAVRLPSDAKEELGQKSGLLIVSVETDSPAEKGGLLLGDAIVGLSEASIRHHEDLLAQLGGDVVGKKTPVKIIRGGEIRTINVTIGERP
jgi:S1-C subfamily serine protease